jgi:fructuronate reductase
LAKCGVRVTSQVHSYEEAKLRMLNGSHSAMALMGAIAGRPYIASCIGVDHIREFVYRLMSRGSGATLKSHPIGPTTAMH